MFPEFKSMREIIKEVGLITFIKSRFVSIKSIIWEYNGEFSCPENRPSSIGEAIFNARYHEGKAFEGYDFVTRL